VLKDAALSEIVQAVRTVAMGRTYLSPAMSEYLLERSFPSRRGSPSDSSPLAALSERERHILRLIGDSKTSKEIAESLDLNYRTIENLRAAMSQKLGLQGRYFAVAARSPQTRCRRFAGPSARRSGPHRHRRSRQHPRLDQAEPLYREAYDASRRFLGEDHADIWPTR
jgi:DNA-binding CsgD family transcriptional regulator